uniref:Uncharacterized protein n=1 Tax=Steinernema glaseri TaxID=37863 RepID=A0A1I7ZWC4_9BILA
MAFGALVKRRRMRLFIDSFPEATRGPVREGRRHIIMNSAGGDSATVTPTEHQRILRAVRDAFCLCSQSSLCLCPDICTATSWERVRNVIRNWTRFL